MKNLEDNWISVKDKLPEEDQTILCLIATKELIINGMWIPTQRVLKYGDFLGNGRSIFINNNTQNSYEPTHWMPLPKPPKKDINSL